MSQALRDCFDPTLFSQYGHEVIDLLTHYLTQSQSRDIAPLPHQSPDQVLARWTTDFPELPNIQGFVPLLREYISQTNHIMNPRSTGHQTAVPLPLSSLVSLTNALLNSSMSSFETGPISSVLETTMIRYLASLVGFDAKRVGGFFCSGGTLGNITALLSAVHITGIGDIWRDGVAHRDHNLCVMMSSESHYALRRSLQIMGFGENNIVLIPVNSEARMDKSAIESCYTTAIHAGKRVVALVVSCCNTGPGMIESINEAADFCEEHTIWLHVDGAHGASALMHSTYKELLAGIHRADSVVRDMHKLMMTPTLLTAVIFRKHHHASAAVNHKAHYLYEMKTHDNRYDVSQRTIECSKSAMVMVLYISLMTHGTKIFADYIGCQFDRARWFAKELESRQDFLVPFHPDANIVLFRYIPPFARERLPKDINRLQRLVRSTVLAGEGFYFVKTEFEGLMYLRCSLMNPLTTAEDLCALLDEIERIGYPLAQQMYGQSHWLHLYDE